jgi:hypothetical protein
MIVLCPFCGFKLSCAIQNGITTCDNCKRIFTNSPVIKVLSAAWNVRNWHVCDLETIQKQCELTDEEAFLVKKYVMDDGLSHDVFFKIVEKYAWN